MHYPNFSVELSYSDCDDDGSDYSEHSGKTKMPKWRTPLTPFQIRFLSIFGMKYFPKNKDLHYKIIIIEKSMMPLAGTNNLEKAPLMPTEWVEFCIEWCLKKRSSGSLVQIEALVHFIENDDARLRFIEKRIRTQQREEVTVKEYTSNVHVEKDVTHGMETTDDSPFA